MHVREAEGRPSYSLKELQSFVTMAYVIKIKYGKTLRRLTMQRDVLDDIQYQQGRFSFGKLESRIRELLQVPASAKLELTYTDSESDVVIMSTDEDVQDALLNQGLNPLRVTAILAEDKSSPSPSPSAATAAVREEEKAATPSSAKAEKKSTSGIDIEVPLRQILGRLSSTSDSVVKKIVQSYEPLFEKVSSPAQATGLVENLMRTISAQVATAVKHGADAATSAAVAASATPAFGFGSGMSSSGPAPSPAPSFAPANGTFTANPTTPSFNTSSETASTTSSRSSDAFTAAAAAVAAEAEAAAAAAVDAVFKGTNESDNVVHHGVTCDICNVNPIVGVRWKSTKRHNYDMCSGCFEKHGKQADFTKLEQSMFRPRRFHSHGPGPHFSHRMPMGIPFGGPNPGHFPGGKPFGGRCGSFGARHHNPMMGFGGKLDARFVCDVTMFDGTEITPGTRFTKIWRLRNSGTIPWPVRTNLVHVGGDELGESKMVPMEIPPEGLPTEGEMEAAVDMIAPEKPGRYVSHWRLASPAGPKFGHRIWAVIQVVMKESEEQDDGQVEGEVKRDSEVAEVNEVNSGDQNQMDVDVVKSADEESTISPKPHQLESAMSFVNVEVPSGEMAEAAPVASPADAVPAATQTREVEVEPAEEKNLSSAAEADLSEGYSMVDVPEQREKSSVEETLSSHVAVQNTPLQEDETAVSQQVKVAPADEGPIAYPSIENITFDDGGPISYPVIQLVPANVSENEDLSPESAAVPVQDAEGSNLTALMAKLQTMGFDNAKLNMELLEKNSLDLRQTLNDLCAVEEWDPMLEELEEMGFYDADVNRRLMFKNNGSIKKVVKDLVTMYRQQGEKGKEKALE